MTDYNEVLTRIKNIYSSMNHHDQQIMKTILKEIYQHGDSKTYQDIWLQDYKEIPVDINTFLCDDAYLGKITRQGKSIYPHWHQVLGDIFNAGNKYHEVIFTGATRIGKSSTAITATAYMLYKLMCLRDPQQFFGKKDVSKFSILFFNLTERLAKSVAYREFNDTLRASPWFMEHGKVSRSDRDFYYIPEGNKIIIDSGSDASHALGQQVFVGFCVVGDTKLILKTSEVCIKDVVNQEVELLQYDYFGNTHFVLANIVKTKYVTDTIKVTLEDGSTFEGTPEHKVLLTNGFYKMLKDLTLLDDILTL